MRRLLVVLTLSILCAVSLAGCSSGGDDRPTPSPSATSASSATSPSEPSPTPDDSSSASPASRGGGPATCATADLAVSVEPDRGGGAAGSTYDTISLRNTGAETCSMTGWPGVSFVAGDEGDQVGAAAERTGDATVITLAPGDAATSSLQVAAAGSFSPCSRRDVRGLRVYPPNQRAAVFVKLPTTACSQASAAQLSVSPVVAGG